MPQFAPGWRDAMGRRTVARPPRSEASLVDMLATAEGRRAQVDAAYRRAVRQARAEGRQPPQYRSVERRIQRYARAENRPPREELAKMRRLHHREEKKAAAESVVIANMREINRRGGVLHLERPELRVSPKARKGDKRGRSRPSFSVPIRPGDLSLVIYEESQGNYQAADRAMTELVQNAPYFDDRLLGTDTTVTRVGRISVEQL